VTASFGMGDCCEFYEKSCEWWEVGGEWRGMAGYFFIDCCCAQPPAAFFLVFAFFFFVSPFYLLCFCFFFFFLFLFSDKIFFAGFPGTTELENTIARINRSTGFGRHNKPWLPWVSQIKWIQQTRVESWTHRYKCSVRTNYTTYYIQML